MPDEQKRWQPPMVANKSEIYEDPLQFLWAISYADMLMVLMSFFVIYFSLDEIEQKQTVFDDIVVALQERVEQRGIATEESGQVPGKGPGPGGNVPVDPTTSAAVGTNYNPLFEKQKHEQLKGPITFQAVEKTVKMLDPKSKAKVVAHGFEQLIVHFPANVYKPRGFELGEDTKAQLTTLISGLKPFESQIHLTFIGHTDAQPVKSYPTDIIDSNIMLSSVRATKAAEYAIKVAGFNPAHVSTGGFAQYERSTRSFSIRITERGKR